MTPPHPDTAALEKMLEEIELGRKAACIEICGINSDSIPYTVHALNSSIPSLLPLARWALSADRALDRIANLPGSGGAITREVNAARSAFPQPL